MNKEIYFCVDINSFNKYSEDIQDKVISKSYQNTEYWINNNLGESNLMITLSLAHLSFDLIKMGYDIYLCYEDTKVKIEPHMNLTKDGSPCKDLKSEHNILKLFIAGVFNEILNIHWIYFSILMIDGLITKPSISSSLIEFETAFRIMLYAPLTSALINLPADDL